MHGLKVYHGYVFGSNDSPERWSELAGGKVNTVGESIVINSEKHLWVPAGLNFLRMHCEECRNWEESAGDTLFTRSGSRYTAAY